MSSSYVSSQHRDYWKYIQSIGAPISYKWIIPKFNWTCGKKESPTFFPQSSDFSKFRLLLKPQQQTPNVLRNQYNPGCTGIQVEMKMVETTCLNIDMVVQFWIVLESYTTDKLVAMCVSSPSASNSDIFEFSLTNKRFSKTTHRKDFQPDDVGKVLIFGDRYNVLSIQCRGKVIVNNREPHYKIPHCKILDNIGAMLYSETLSDVTLVVEWDDAEIPAHKVILAAQSAVFAAMFKHDMTESQQNRVLITDIKPQVVKEMLRFLYTGRTPHLDTIAGDLLAAADKYALDELKEICEDYLLKNVSIETSCDTLRLADVHSAKLLKVATIDYITENIRVMDIMKTDGWKEISSTHPHVVVEAFQVFASKQQSTSPTNSQ